VVSGQWPVKRQKQKEKEKKRKEKDLLHSITQNVLHPSVEELAKKVSSVLVFWFCFLV